MAWGLTAISAQVQSRGGLRREQDRPHRPGHLPPGAPKLLITPIFPDFSRFFPVFPWTSSRVPRIPGVQTEKMGEKWGKMGKKWAKNEITGLRRQS